MSTTPSTSPTRPSAGLPAIPTSTAVLLAVALITVAATVLGMLLIVGPEHVGDTQVWITTLVSAVSAAFSGTAMTQVQRVARGQAITHEDVSTVKAQTNGRLDRLFSDTRAAIVADVAAMLAAAPATPADDAPPVL